MVEQGDRLRLRVGRLPNVELGEANACKLGTALRELGETGDGGTPYRRQVVPVCPLPYVEVVELRPGVADPDEVVVGHREGGLVREEVECHEVWHLRQELLDEIREGDRKGIERGGERGTVVGDRVGDMGRNGG